MGGFFVFTRFKKYKKTPKKQQKGEKKQKLSTVYTQKDLLSINFSIII